MTRFTAWLGKLDIEPLIAASDLIAEHAYLLRRAQIRAKHQMSPAEESLAAEVNVLARRLARLASSHRPWRDFTLSSLTRALVETLAAFPVYRTYLRAQDRPAPDDEPLTFAS